MFDNIDQNLPSQLRKILIDQFITRYSEKYPIYGHGQQETKELITVKHKPCQNVQRLPWRATNTKFQ